MITILHMVEELLCNGSVTSMPLSPQDPQGLPIPLHHWRPPFVQDPGASPGLHRPTVMLGDPANTSPLFFFLPRPARKPDSDST